MTIENCTFNDNRLKTTGHTPINCDQVAWLLDMFERYLPKKVKLGISREHEMLKYGMLYEVMDIAKLKFEDEAARWNGTPNDARDHSGEDVPEIGER